MADEKCTLSNEELAEKVSKGISELCKTGGKSFTMHVPARLNEDLDLIVSEMVSRFRDLAGAKKPDASANTLPIQNVTHSAFRICEHCNKEYQLELSSTDGKYFVNNFQKCPHCKKRDDAWIKIVVEHCG